MQPGCHACDQSVTCIESNRKNTTDTTKTTTTANATTTTVAEAINDSTPITTTAADNDDGYVVPKYVFRRNIDLWRQLHELLCTDKRIYPR